MSPQVLCRWAHIRCVVCIFKLLVWFQQITWQDTCSIAECVGSGHSVSQSGQLHERWGFSNRLYISEEVFGNPRRLLCTIRGRSSRPLLSSKLAEIFPIPSKKFLRSTKQKNVCFYVFVNAHWLLEINCLRWDLNPRPGKGSITSSCSIKMSI